MAGITRSRLQRPVAFTSVSLSHSGLPSFPCYAILIWICGSVTLGMDEWEEKQERKKTVQRPQRLHLPERNLEAFWAYENTRKENTWLSLTLFSLICQYRKVNVFVEIKLNFHATVAQELNVSTGFEKYASLPKIPASWDAPQILFPDPACPSRFPSSTKPFPI